MPGFCPPLRSSKYAIGDGKTQFWPTATLDQKTGNLTAIWYDTQNDASGNKLVQVLGAVSADGGLTFTQTAPTTPISPGQSDGTVTGYQNQLGTALGLDYYNGVFWSAWADNSNSTGDNPDGTRTKTDIYVRKTTVTVTAPSHLSAIAAPIAPAVTGSISPSAVLTGLLREPSSGTLTPLSAPLPPHDSALMPTAAALESSAVDDAFAGLNSEEAQTGGPEAKSASAREAGFSLTGPVWAMSSNFHWRAN
jgi:hypothetical protein